MAPRDPIVLFLDHSGLPGGGQLGLARYIEGSQLDKRPSVAFFGDGDTFDRLEEVGSRATHVSSSPKLLPDRKQVREMLKLAKASDASLIVANSTRAAAFLAATPAIASVGKVFYMRDDLNAKRNSAAKRAFLSSLVIPRFDGFIANSRWTATTLPGFSGGRRSVEIAYPVCGVKSGLLAEPRPPSKPDEPLKILSLSRLDEWKGIHRLIGAAKQLERRGYTHKFALTIAGAAVHANPSYLAHLHELANGLLSEVEFVGHRRDVSPLLADADCLFAVSETAEPFGQVVVQGQAHGLVVVAGREGGPLEIIRDMIDGILIPPADETRLADSLELLLTDRDRLEQLSQNAARKAARFADEHTVGMMDDALRRIHASLKSCA